MTNLHNEWWRKATIYQIYPKSFCDIGGKGTGDIQGIISKLDYLHALGIDAIWLTPIYCSPMIDNGYDISDYYNINPDFGCMADFDQLLLTAHQKGIRIILDIVVNHTSTEHQWFQSAIADKNSPYRDYYIWQDPKNGREPNNWQSKFGGNAWKFDQKSGQYYLHLFAEQQADLNWENPKVRAEVENIISFWAEKGVDGFRLDVINLISKQPSFPEDESDGRKFYTDGPRAHEYLQRLSESVFNKYGSVTVGEMSSTSLAHCQQYSATDATELSMVFNFHHLKTDYKNGDKWTNAPLDLLQLKQIFNYWQQGMYNKGWSALFWCNHDQPRIVSRFGDDKKYRVQSAKMLANALHMMQGTPYIYQGEEIAMTNPHYQSISQYRDLESINMHRIMLEEGKTEQQVMAILANKSRDNSRTPMQWNKKDQAGFSDVQPWITVASNYPEINVEDALLDQNSVFYHYQRLLILRKQLDVICWGDYQDLCPEHEQLFCYQRTTPEQKLLCINNFSAEQVPYALPDSLCLENTRVIIANYNSPEQVDRNGQVVNSLASKAITLRPFESLVLLEAV